MSKRKGLNGSDACCGKMLGAVFGTLPFIDGKLYVVGKDGDGTEIKEQVKFCPFCGKPVASMVRKIQ